MKNIYWRNIPEPRFPVNLNYLCRWIMKPFGLLIYSLLCKIKNNFIFYILFCFVNFFIRWKINIQIEKDKIFVIDKKSDYKLFISRKEYLPQFKSGIESRLRKLNKEYLLDNISFNQNDLIIDVGASIGEVSFFLATNFRCRVICYEPEKLEFECLKLNLSKSGKHHYHKKILWKKTQSLKFYSQNELHDSSCFETEYYTTVKLRKAYTLNQELGKILSKKNKVKLLKLEAEGAEPEILIGAKRIIRFIDYVSIDVGAERGLSYQTTITQCIKFMKNNNFELIDVGSPRLMCLFRNKY